MIDWSDYANFSRREFVCHCGCGKADMSPDFMAVLQRVRTLYGKPMSVTSGFRCPEYDKRIGGVGVHPTGQAADIAVSGENAYHLLSAAIGIGMTGIGIKQHGPYAGRFLHLDGIISEMHPRPVTWSYRA